MGSGSCEEGLGGVVDETGTQPGVEQGESCNLHARQTQSQGSGLRQCCVQSCGVRLLLYSSVWRAVF